MGEGATFPKIELVNLPVWEKCKFEESRDYSTHYSPSLITNMDTQIVGTSVSLFSVSYWVMGLVSLLIMGY